MDDGGSFPGSVSSTLRIGGFEVHPVADAFPLIEGTEFDELRASVKGLGLVNPIILLDGKVIDGRNRLRAAVAEGVTKIPTQELPAGTDAVAYVMAQNIERRHLTPRQRATITVLLMEVTGELAKVAEAAKESRVAQLRQGDVVPSSSGDGNGAGRVSERVAELAGVSSATAERVLKVKRTDPARFEAEVQAAKTGAKVPPKTKPPRETDSRAIKAAPPERTIQVPVGDAAAAVRVLAKHYELADFVKAWPKGKRGGPSRMVPSSAAASNPGKKTGGGEADRWMLHGSRGRVPGWVLETTGLKSKSQLRGAFGVEATFTKGAKLPMTITEYARTKAGCVPAGVESRASS